MITKTMKWISIAALFVLFVFLWRSSISAVVLICGLLVWAGATLVGLEALRAQKYVFAIVFAVILLFFNPIFPVQLVRSAFIAAYGFSAIAFASALLFLKATPRLSVQSVTDLSPRSTAL